MRKTRDVHNIPTTFPASKSVWARRSPYFFRMLRTGSRLRSALGRLETGNTPTDHQNINKHQQTSTNIIHNHIYILYVSTRISTSIKNQPRIFKTQNKPKKQTTIVSNDRQSITNHHQSTSIISNPQHSPPTETIPFLSSRNWSRKNRGNPWRFLVQGFKGFNMFSPSVSIGPRTAMFFTLGVSAHQIAHPTSGARHPEWSSQAASACENGTVTCHTKTSISFG